MDKNKIEKMNKKISYYENNFINISDYILSILYDKKIKIGNDTSYNNQKIKYLIYLKDEWKKGNIDRKSIIETFLEIFNIDLRKYKIDKLM